MIEPRRRRTRLAAAAAATTSIGVLAASSPAGADIQGWRWADTAMQLQLGVNSNQVGFWETLLVANDQCVTLNGQFQASDRSATMSFQQGVLSYPLPNRPVDGIVGWRTFDDTQNAVYAEGVPRLSTGDGIQYSYYAGSGRPSASLIWQGGATGKWKYQSPANGQWYVATTSLTQPNLGSSC